MTAVIDIDGSMGEGGGQVLRTSLSLSLVTGKAFRMRRVRAGRQKPGLLRQHLTAIKAAAAVSGAEVVGDHVGSQDVTFRPGAVKGGEHTFAVGTAGSATLVFQTVLPALLAAEERSSLAFEGGTHNDAAPPYDFLAKAFLPLLARMGARVTTRLERRGFYPAGGGRFTATVEPAGPLRPIEIESRGAIRSRRARVLLQNLDRRIAEREAARLSHLLPSDLWTIETEAEQNPRGPGNAVVLEVEAEHVTEVFTAFGAIGVRAEAVAERAVDEMRSWLAADVPVGPHLADQLLLPLALAGSGSFRALPLTRHATTNRDVIRLFLPHVAIDVESVDGRALVRVR